MSSAITTGLPSGVSAATPPGEVARWLPHSVAVTTAVQNRFGYEIRHNPCVFTGNVIPGKTDGVGRINDLTQIIPGVILISVTAHILFSSALTSSCS